MATKPLHLSLLFSLVVMPVWAGSSTSNQVDEAKSASSIELTNEFQSLLTPGKEVGWVTDAAKPRQGGQEGKEIFQVKGKEILVYEGASAEHHQPIAVFSTQQSFSEYVFEVDYRWTGPRYHPRIDADRDAGVLFHLEDKTPMKVWPPCVECQIGESAAGGPYVTGDLWVIGKHYRVQTPRRGGKYASVKDGGKLETVGAKPFVPSRTPITAVKPDLMEWNTIRIVVKANEYAIFQVNGKTVNEVVNIERRVDDQWTPLKAGRIGFQAEYAGLIYRDPRIRQILPDDAKPE